LTGFLIPNRAVRPDEDRQYFDLAEDKNLVFDFEDNGIGIKRENFKKIFEPMIIVSSKKTDAIFNARVGLRDAKGITDRKIKQKKGGGLKTSALFCFTIFL